MPICEQCGKEFDVSEGLWDDGDYMCGECVAGYVEPDHITEAPQPNPPPELDGHKP